MPNIVCFNYLGHLFCPQFLSHTSKCLSQISCGYLLGLVDVKVAEEGPKAFFGEERLDLEGGRDEFCVVDLAVAMLINILDNIVDVFVGQTRLNKHLPEFFGV